MINVETLKLLKVIEELCELSKAGTKPFSECTEENDGRYVFYDERKQNPDGSYKICLDTLVLDEHHDVISYYEHYRGDNNPIDKYCTIGVLTDEEGCHITIKVADEEIIIDNGSWYFV